MTAPRVAAVDGLKGKKFMSGKYSISRERNAPEFGGRVICVDLREYMSVKRLSDQVRTKKGG